MRRGRSGWLWLALLALAPMSHAARLEFVWPTPDPAFMAGRSSRTFLQQAGSGDPASGGYGAVRSGGRQFHEGLDLKPLRRDRRGEPLDEVRAAMAGVVRHVNAVAGKSSYGRYIVIEHPDLTPAVYTLYAHLNRIEKGVTAGTTVRAGQTIGTMGHTAGGYSIPKSRAHLHFEIGLWITRSFQRWYDRRKFGSANDHGIWNGMNLMGIDPLDFLTRWRDGRMDTLQEYFASMPVAVRIKVATKRVPDFVERYPSLLKQPVPAAGVAGWEIGFERSGLPVTWKPLAWNEVLGLTPERPEIVAVDAAVVRNFPCKDLVRARRGGGWTIDRDLQTVLQQLFL